MGRISDAKDRLIEATEELIWSCSYGSTSVDQICERAGVKKGSFYHFFESKATLALAAVEHSWEIYKQDLDRIFSPVHPPLQRILDSFRNLRREQEAMLEKHGVVLGCPIHSLGAEVSTYDPTMQQRLMEILELFYRYYESAIRDGQADGSMRDGDARLLARTVFAYSEGLLLHARIMNNLSPLDDFEEGTKHILCHPHKLP